VVELCLLREVISLCLSLFDRDLCYSSLLDVISGTRVCDDKVSAVRILTLKCIAVLVCLSVVCFREV
jgi:hypothetical protein